MAESQATSSEASPSLAQFKTMFADLLAETKSDILDQVKQSIHQVYTDFEAVALPPTEDEDHSQAQLSEGTSDIGSRASLIDQIDQLATPNTPVDSDGVKALALEFSTAEKTSAALNNDLADLVNGLINDRAPKEKLGQLLAKYLRPENCPLLLPPKVNKQVWQQLRQETRNSDSAWQKSQGLLMGGIYALLQLCNESKGTPMDALIHAIVLLLSANRDINLKRRESLRPDLNKQYGALCNPSTSISAFLFGDDLNKDVEDLTKSNKLSVKVNQKQRLAPYRVPSASRSQPRFCSQSTGVRSSRPSRPFFGTGRGHSRPPPPVRFNKNKV